MTTTATRATCPYCGKRVTLTRTGHLHRHTTESGATCIRRSPS